MSGGGTGTHHLRLEPALAHCLRALADPTSPSGFRVTLTLMTRHLSAGSLAAWPPTASVPRKFRKQPGAATKTRGLRGVSRDHREARAGQQGGPGRAPRSAPFCSPRGAVEMPFWAFLSAPSFHFLSESSCS